MSKAPYKIGKQSCKDKNKQAWLAQSLPCPNYYTKLVNNPVKTNVNRLGSLSPFRVQSTLQDWKPSCSVKSEQAGLAKARPCPTLPTRLVNSLVKTKVNRLGSLIAFHVQSTLQDW